MRNPALWRIGGLLVLLVCAGASSVSAQDADAILEVAKPETPENLGPGVGGLLPTAITESAKTIDTLFWIIFWITGVVFVLTEGALIWFIWKYRKREGHTAYYTHGSHTVEVIWTIIPAAILAVIVFIQVQTWTGQKVDMPEDGMEVHILGKQFEWHYRYQGADKTWGTQDDFETAELVVPTGENVVFRIRSLDVLHSFFLPHCRFKQDAVPGTTQQGWINVNEEFAGQRFPVVCAELCGSGHHTMASVLIVLSPADFARWYQAKSKEAIENGGIDYSAASSDNFRWWKIKEGSNK